MIGPDGIRRKAENLYPDFLRAWLANETFFPRIVPCDLRLDGDLAASAGAVNALRSASKESRGFGYSVEWTEIRSRTHGRNSFPSRISFDSQADFLRYIDKESAFDAFSTRVRQIVSQYPELQPWVEANRRRLNELVEDAEGLLRVVNYLRRHPRPGLFSRELPVDVDTKFVERNRLILREWLDRLLPADTIRADEEHFERRFGLRYSEPDVALRFLTPEVQSKSGSLWAQLSLPLSIAAQVTPCASQAIVVENKVNLLTLPPIGSTVGLGGLGYAVTDLRYLPWLHSLALWYWGDIDVDGFTILSRIRTILPHTKSIMMDAGTLERWREVAVPGNGYSRPTPPCLTREEEAAWRVCHDENLRIEQERIPQSFSTERLLAAHAGLYAV